MLPHSLPHLRTQLEAAIDKHGLRSLARPILDAAEPCILLYEPNEPNLGQVHEAMRQVDPTIPAKLSKVPINDLLQRWRARQYALSVGASFLGGLPDLPAGTPWPQHDGRRLPFTAQFDLAALPSIDPSALPRRGWLSLFAANNDNFPLAVAAIHHTGPRDALARAAAPPANEFHNDWLGRCLYRAVPVTAADLAVSLPGYDTDWWDSLEFDDDDQQGRLTEMTDDLRPTDDANRAGVSGQILGHMGFPGATPQDAVEFGGRTGDDWTALLQIHTVGDMRFSDEGALNVLARRSDLARADFGNVYAAVYSS